MSAGLLRQRPTFQTRGLDDNGEPSANADWVDPGLTVWARVVALKGSEPVIQQRLQGVQPVSVTIRASSATRAISTAWRMVWQGVNYNIEAVAPDERGVYLNIMAKADQSDA